MNNDESKTILIRLNAVYEGFEYKPSVVYEWQKAFDKDSFQNVSTAVDEYIKNSPPDAVPTINQIRSHLPTRRNVYATELWIENRKWRYEVQKIKKKLDNGKEIEVEEAVKREMRYHVNRWGEIEDEYGRIYADPDEETNRQLINKVRATGRLV